MGSTWVLAIDILAVCHFQDHHRDPFILDIANQPVVADPISPKSPFIAVRGLAPLSWILGRLQPLTQKANDGLLSRAVELFDLLLGGPGNLNRPDQDGAPVRRA